MSGDPKDRRVGCRDEERRGAIHSASHAAYKVLADPFEVGMVCQIVGKTFDIEIQIGCVLEQIFRFQSLLIFKESVVHLPEFALPSSVFSRFSSEFRMWVDCRQREIPENESELIAHSAKQLHRDGMSLPAKGGTRSLHIRQA